MIEKPTKTLWHATYGTSVSSIEKEGLIIGKEKVWEEAEPFIYLAIDEEIACSYCEVALNDMDEDRADKLEASGIYAIEIDTSKLDLDSLEIDDNNLSNFDEKVVTYQYSKNISPECFIGIKRNS